MSEHDHKYYNGSVTDVSLFQIPLIVHEYFNEQDVLTPFSREDVDVLSEYLQQSQLGLFVEHLVSSEKFMKVFTSKLSFHYKTMVS